MPTYYSMLSRRLATDLGYGPEGAEALMSEEEAYNSSGSLRVYVLCPELNEVLDGRECPSTHLPGRCEGCEIKEEI